LVELATRTFKYFEITCQKELPAYTEMLNEMGKEAASNGLSKEKPDEEMEWDEETVKNLFGETNNNV
jgi:hypothetical protein